MPTCRIPEKSVADHLLKLAGKKRGIIVPPNDREGYYQLQKESFWKALVRPAGEPLPSGVVDFDDLNLQNYNN